jgi:hypothetical protein
MSFADGILDFRVLRLLVPFETKNPNSEIRSIAFSFLLEFGSRLHHLRG